MSQIERHDVIVVGAGPAGSTAAYHLAGPFDVLIVDKKAFPRPKACGGALVACRDWTRRFPNYAEVEAGLTAFSCEALHLCVGRTPWWEGRNNHFFDQISRDEFDHALMRAALARPGVAFRVFNVRTVERLSGGGVRLGDGNTTLEAPVVIGADGCSSALSRAVGNPVRGVLQAGGCVVSQIVCDRTHDDAWVYYLWDDDLGYCWLFPTTNGYNLGAGFIGRPRNRAKRHLKALFAHCIERGLIPREHERRTFGGLAPTTVTEIVATDDILLVGDAAGLVNQLNGEGISNAMLSGQIAGRILAECLDSPASRYRRALAPVIAEVSYTKTIRPRLFHSALRSYFRLVHDGRFAGIDERLKLLFVNRFNQRHHLDEGSQYKRFGLDSSQN